MQVLDLCKETPLLDLAKEMPAMKACRLSSDWDPNPNAGTDRSKQFDLDIFIFGLNQAGKLTAGNNVCYYKNKHAMSNSVHVPIDNLDGSGDEDEYGQMDFPEVPQDIFILAAYVFVYEASKRGQHFGMISNAKVKLTDAANPKVPFQTYRVSEFIGATALHVGNFVRTPQGWVFEPQGVAGNMGPNEVAAAYM